jgi:hypothetical protein
VNVSSPWLESRSSRPARAARVIVAGACQRDDGCAQRAAWVTSAVSLALVTLAVPVVLGQTVTVEADVTAGYSKEGDNHVSALATQIRSFGELRSGLRFFVEGVWGNRSGGDTSDAFSAAYPYGGRVQAMEAYAEQLFTPRRTLLGFRAGRYRTPFGIYNRSDYDYSGLLRAPLVRYAGYFALSNTFLEQGVDVTAGIPQLNVETSLGVPADVGGAIRRSGFDSVTRVQAYYGSVIVGASRIMTNPSQPATFAVGRAVFNGLDLRWMQSGFQVTGEWLGGQPFNGTTTTGWHLDGSVHQPRMGPVTAVLRVEQLDYDTAISEFVIHARRQTAGARVRLPRGVTAQVGFLHQQDSSQPYRKAMDAALTYSLRLH